MKKIALVLSGLVLLFSCSPSFSNEKDSIVGSIWTCQWGTDKYPDLIAIEFLSSSGCSAYHTDEQFHVDGERRGTYTLNGSEIQFNNLEIVDYGVRYKIVSGTLSGSRMGVKTSHYSNFLNKNIEDNYTFVRQK